MTALVFHRCLVVSFSLLAVGSADPDACTSIAIGHGASVDGSGFATHNNDCATCDPRIAFIPSRNYALGAKRPIAPLKLEYPRYVGVDRSTIYAPVGGQAETRPLGFIDQVPHTYAYWEAAYPLVNEHGLGFGESTCGANLIGLSAMSGGEALFSVAELMRVALERCMSARCAIMTMGVLAVEHGFYGEDPGLPGAGEALSVVDGNETWVFHITGGLRNKSATWVAQRVPDNHVAIIGNNFIIKKVNCKDGANFMCSSNIYSNALEAKLCDLSSESDLDWLRCYAPDIRKYQYMPQYPPIPMYSMLRVWRIQTLANPDLGLRLSDDPYDFSFSVPVAKKVTRSEVMDWMRDHYAGTEYDMTVGSLAGAHGNPNRLEGGMGLRMVRGQFARGISIPRTNYGLVVEAKAAPKAAQSIAWFATDQPISSVFVPFIASTDQAADAYCKGQQEAFSRDSAWWAFNFVSNWMNINWREMMQRHVGPAMGKEQKHILSTVEALETRWPDDKHAVNRLQKRLQESLVQSWWTLADDLIVHFSDGVYTHKNSTKTSLGYPAWWLQMIGFSNEFWKIQWVQWARLPPPLLLGTVPAPADLKATEVGSGPSALGTFIPSLVAGAAVGGAVAVAMLRRRPADFDKSVYTLVE